MLPFLLLVFSCALCQYKVTNEETNATSVKLLLQYTGDDDYYIKNKSKIIKELKFQFFGLTYQDFNFKISDPNHQRFEVPQGGIFPEDPEANFSFPIAMASYRLTYSKQKFEFKVTKANDPTTVLFDSSQAEFIFSDYYIQIATKISSCYAYGFSERFTQHLRLKPGKWTIFPRDRGQMLDSGIGRQTHGYYPVYLLRQASFYGSDFHLSYFRTSNAMDILMEESDNQCSLTYKVIGGIIDFRFFVGDGKVETLLSRFHDYLGRSTIPPFWAMGFHQSRWGYNNVSQLETVLQNFQKNDLPLDTIWSDIDYMQAKETFTVDVKRFPLDRMRAILKNYQYVPIVEPSIRDGQGYAYQEGLKRNVYIKDGEGKDYQVGKVWAGKVYFTDYFHPNATQYWIDMMQHLYDQIAFSGAWIDMNEISNLCNGPCETPNVSTPTIDFSNDIPYHPGLDNIQTQAIPLNATHHGQLLQQNVHTFFGFMQNYETYQFLKTKGKFPFIITRSNTLGTNKYGFHWTGDNLSNFTFLQTSISSHNMFALWGIQMVGSDICGFGGNATEDNCARWFQIGSLYPFARNHNQNDTIDQQPYALGDKVLKASHTNLKFRYSFLKSYYREFIVRRGAGSIVKPLFFVFPQDGDEPYKDEYADTQFMLGDSLMSAPIVEESTTTRTVFFPGEKGWFDFHTGEYLSKRVDQISNQITELVPLYLRPGYLTFIQDVKNVTKTRQLNSQFVMVMGCEQDYQYQCSSKGGILSIQDYNSDSNIAGCLEEGCEYRIMAEVREKEKTMDIEVIHYGPVELRESIKILGFRIYTSKNKYIFDTEEPLILSQSKQSFKVELRDSSMLRTQN